MSEHVYNSPKWWASFLRWEPGVQLEFVHEAIAMEHGLSPRWADEFWADAHSSWEENGRVHVFDGELSMPELAMILAGHEFVVRHDVPLVIDLVDVVEEGNVVPLALPRYSVAKWNINLKTAAELLRTRFVWIAGWRLHRLKTRGETTLYYGAARTTPKQN